MSRIKTFVNFITNKKVVFIISICVFICCFLSVCQQIRCPDHTSYVNFDDLIANDGYNPIGYYILICLDLIFIGRPSDYNTNYCSDYFVDLTILIVLFVLLVILLIFKKKNYFLISFSIISLSVSNCFCLSSTISMLQPRSITFMVMNIIIGLITGLYYLLLGIKSIADFSDPPTDLKNEMRVVLTIIFVISPFLVAAVITNLINTLYFMPSYDITETTPSMVIKYLYLTSTPFWKRCPSSATVFDEALAGDQLQLYAET